MELLLILLLIVLFIAAVLLCISFTRKANNVFENESEATFVTVSNIKQEYNRYLHNRNNKYSMIYVNVSDDEIKKKNLEVQENSVKRIVKNFMLRSFVSEDKSMLAPYGNTDYLILTKKSENEVKLSAELLTEEIKSFLEENSIIGEVKVIFGAYFNPSNDISFDEAVERAKIASRYAENNEITYSSWNYKLHNLVVESDRLKKIIQKEVQENHFFFEWQPIVNINTGKPVSAEALSRLNSENNGVITPGKFVPVLSEVGISEKFDYYIFEKSCKWMSNRIKMGKPYIGISVNFFRSTIAGENFVKTITDIMRKYEIPFGVMRIEILELNLKASHTDDILIRNLKELRKEGVLIMLDDFGAGASSFADIQNYPVDIVKIDRSIIVNSTTPIGFSILKNVVKMAKDIGLEVICEGVDSQEQFEIVRDTGCELVQGFYFYKPMSLTSFEELLENKEEAYGKV